MVNGLPVSITMLKVWSAVAPGRPATATSAPPSGEGPPATLAVDDSGAPSGARVSWMG